MGGKLKPQTYHSSLLKRVLDLVISILGLIILSPLIFLIASTIKVKSKGSVFFTQKRVGKGGAPFKIIMFRTMYQGAEKDQKEYQHLNEADGPVFKIRNDPRFVGIGNFLAKSGLDELPQLINVLKGEMSLVGPRPLPVNEAKKLTQTQKARELIKPGITSSWVVSGAHSLSFRQWMKLDRQYVQKASLKTDFLILFTTLTTVIKLILRYLKGRNY
jgi:lipopolysaccharide/colanic/teichoic acid biosynthesis glycosyltransferase